MRFRPAFLLLAVAFALVNQMVRSEPHYPPALQAGDTIAIVAPSRYMDDNERMEKTIAGLKRMGFDVIVAPNVTTRNGYLAGGDEDRAAGIMNAWRDPKVKAIFCATGGYGTTRIVDLLDYQYIQNNPKILVGFSDITGLHLAIQKKAEVVTFHGPMTTAAYTGDFDARPVQAEWLWKNIMPSRDPRTGAPFPNTPVVYTDDGLTTKMVTLSSGVGKGRLIGGNLSVLHALMGTEYEVDTDGRILFLEDVHEEPYRVDRMLSTLKLAGKLENCAGVILGQWDECETNDPDRSFTLRQVFDQYFRNRDYPVVYQFPIGHVIDNMTLPEGVMAELDGDARTLTLLESPTQRSE